jgi:hypothetical protein
MSWRGWSPSDSTTTAFAPIVYIASVPSVLVVSPKVDAQSVTDFIVQMKARPEGANFGSAGMGSTGHKDFAETCIGNARYCGDAVELEVISLRGDGLIGIEREQAVFEAMVNCRH